MTETKRSDGTPSPGEPVTRNKGQSLVEAFRLARIAQRPALRTELQAGRMALRASRAARLGCSPAPVAHQTEAAAQDIAESPSPPAADLPETGQSIFAGFCGHVETCAPTQPDDCAPQQNDTAPEMSAPSDHDTPAAASLPLSAIGFGPGMTIRMRQVGIETVSDLAASEPAALRSALGDISQLINVDLWIASARKTQAQ